MKRFLPAAILGTITLVIASLFFIWVKFPAAKAATATHLVISEVQIAGADPDDEFIELYNPTSSDIDLGTFRLVKRTSSGSTDTGIVSFNSGDTIPAHGYYLWCNTNLASTLTCNKDTGTSLSNNNSIALRDGPANTGTIIDAVTFGTVTNTLGEGTSLTAPLASTSAERKANSSSTVSTMAIGGVDEFAGNGEDTDNNANDFLIRDIPQSQNSSSALEPVPTPTPSATPTNTPTLTPTPTPTLTPTLTPTETLTPTVTPTETVTPTPTESPTPTPTNEPTPTNSPTPTLTPTNSPTPTPSVAESPTPTVTPTPNLTPTPTPTPIVIIHTNHLICTLSQKTIHIFSFTINIPVIVCTKI